MPTNLRNFWIDLDIDGYKTPASRGPKSRSGGFNMVLNVASHGESVPLVRICGMPLQNGKNRVIIELDRKLTAGEFVLSELTDSSNRYTLIIEEPRECTCLRAKNHAETRNL